MEKIVNNLNKIDIYLLLIWAGITVIQKDFSWEIDSVFIVCSILLSAIYTLQPNIAVEKLKDKTTLVRNYPILLGVGSGILIMGILFKLMNYPGRTMSTRIGMVAVFIFCIGLFYTPIQGELLPVMKKILLRLFVLIAIGLYVSL